MHASETEDWERLRLRSLPHLFCNRHRGTRQECGNPGLETRGYNLLTPAVAHGCLRSPLRNLSGSNIYQGVGGEFGWVGLGFLVACLLRKINPNPRKKYWLWEKVAQHALTFFCLGWVGLGLGRSFVGFIVIFTFFQPNRIW